MTDRGRLDGLRIGITADRKGAELAASLTRLGADVTWGPTMSAVPPEQDTLLAAETAAILASAPTYIAISTGSGMRAWLEAAERSGVSAELRSVLSSTPVVARGAKSHGALRSLGITPEFVSPKETMDDVCAWLGARVGPADVIAAQLHGGEVVGTLEALRPRVAQVLTVAPYRWVLPEDVVPAQQLIRLIIAGDIDVLAETSAPSVRNLFTIAAGVGALSELLSALRGDICIASVGSVTARAFEEVGIGVDVMPQRPRTADLLRSIGQWAARRSDPQPGAAVGLELVPDALAARIGPAVIRFGPQEFAVLAAMVRRPGVVLRPDALALQAWGHRVPSDISLVRHNIARLRRKLGEHGACVATVRNVGYRYDPAALTERAE